MKYLLLTLSWLLVAYIVIVVFVYFYQRNLLYHPSENNYQDAKIEFDYEEIFIKVDDEIKLKSWIVKKDFKKFKTLVLFHGNAGHLSNRIYKINELNKLNINILLISWRGFSGNKGSPTEKNLYTLSANHFKNSNSILISAISVHIGSQIQEVSPFKRCLLSLKEVFVFIILLISQAKV